MQNEYGIKNNHKTEKCLVSWPISDKIKNFQLPKRHPC